MQIRNIKIDKKSFQLSWQNNTTTEFPFIWLRDNDIEELHPKTRERIFDLTSVSLDIQPENFTFTSEKLVINWPNKKEVANYQAAWLFEHQPGNFRQDKAKREKFFWTSKTLPKISKFNASKCTESKDALYKALINLKENGLIIVEGLDDSLEAGEEFGQLIGCKRSTNFGVMFEVISKPDPINLAYTSMALPLHTDLPNQSMVPSYQFLHCYRNSVSGGESVFADGFKICLDLKKDDPEKFEILTTTSIPWRFHDRHCDIRSHRPIINLNPDGSFNMLVFNAHLADVPDIRSDLLVEFYAAYHDLMQRIRDPKYALHHMLESGQMVIFDNHRLLHSRTSFDPATGDRHLRGYYIENNEIDSRIRMLSKQH